MQKMDTRHGLEVLQGAGRCQGADRHRRVEPGAGSLNSGYIKVAAITLLSVKKQLDHECECREFSRRVSEKSHYEGESNLGASKGHGDVSGGTWMMEGLTNIKNSDVRLGYNWSSCGSIFFILHPQPFRTRFDGGYALVGRKLWYDPNSARICLSTHSR